MEPASTTEKANTSEKANTTEIVHPMTMHPSDLLRCVAGSMSCKDTSIFVTVPTISSWKSVIRAIDAAIGDDVDREFMVTYPRTEAQRARNRKIALENVAAWDAAEKEASLSSEFSSPLIFPIRTKYDIEALPTPKRISEDARKRLKEEDAKRFP
ncbi:hypothetical protein M430DRAFT_31006 [Amorphotheca resinae ATCC 22711]|jgi:hypothetical protein|uniref:Uncharacterized protein n=1 Tax=Amorphotheca resinae ATCC 22711 TaxID=857342 RepID=A0A2T3ARX7_AMORE|nr:hypothetical protein M430DRAFT_31006 [Amorphotheca resinae ATCC 22711]PSS09120.1 hypothetical protein M430DRAFT_31006 [Amorphotheca resinae ATCC 22711]